MPDRGGRSGDHSAGPPSDKAAASAHGIPGSKSDRAPGTARTAYRPPVESPEAADRLPLDADQIRALTAVTASGGLVVFPAETVYGLATDPDDVDAVRRMSERKQRDPAKPSSVLFWSVDDALAALDGAPDAVLRAVSLLLPGPVGLIVPNPQRRFVPACGDDPTSLGIRVPRLGAPVDAPPIVQTSANLAGAPDATTLAAVPDAVRAGAELILDAGERPGIPSTVVDLRGMSDERPDNWRIVRQGPVDATAITDALAHGH